jgi:hypothetical protein
MQEISNEIVLNPQVAPVNISHPGQLVQILDQRTVLVVDNASGRVAVAQSGDLIQGTALGHFPACVVKLSPAYPINGPRGLEGFGGQDGGVGANHAHLSFRALLLDSLGDPAIVRQGRRGGVQDYLIE